ncbi:protein cholesin isoform 1-T1 [Molossus nigricans]
MRSLRGEGSQRDGCCPGVEAQALLRKSTPRDCETETCLSPCADVFALEGAAAAGGPALEPRPASLRGREGGGACLDPELSPELSPEEKRVLERKLKKERRKKERKRLREAGEAPAQQLPAKRSSAQLALDYLCGWAQQHGSWRFQKTRQTWLLLHMYDSHQVPDEHFCTLLAYLAGLKGQARELTVQKAEALMRELDEAGAGSPDRPLLEKTQRVRQVLQLLS